MERDYQETITQLVCECRMLERKCEMKQELIDKALEKLNSFIECCKAEKLESGSDYLHHQYWNMFESFNRQIKDILKEGKNDR